MHRLILLTAFLTLTYADCNFDNWQDNAPNLEDCDLSGQNLSGIDFSYMNLDNANLSTSNLAECDFTGASMVNSNLDGVSTWNTNFTDALMCGVDITSLDLQLGSPITDSDCFDVCGGSSELDECGVCDGDGTACFGCMDPFATNYSELAIYDDGSCEYFDGENSGEAPSMIFDFHSPEIYGDTGWLVSDDLIECIEVEEGNILCSYNYRMHWVSDYSGHREYYNNQYIAENYWMVLEKLNSVGERMWSKAFRVEEYPNNCGSNQLKGILYDDFSYYTY